MLVCCIFVGVGFPAQQLRPCLLTSLSPVESATLRRGIPSYPSDPSTCHCSDSSCQHSAPAPATRGQSILLPAYLRMRVPPMFPSPLLSPLLQFFLQSLLGCGFAIVLATSVVADVARRACFGKPGASTSNAGSVVLTNVQLPFNTSTISRSTTRDRVPRPRPTCCRSSVVTRRNTYGECPLERTSLRAPMMRVCHSALSSSLGNKALLSAWIACKPLCIAAKVHLHHVHFCC